MSGSQGRVSIFVSSAHYGLEDLRGELASFLEELGAEPRLSSERGFPDHPGVPPYAQCLRVLEGTLVVIGIVDKRYGQGFDDWGPYPQYRGLSPTHAELRHALAQKKRLWIYVRSEVQGYYDLYRKNRDRFHDLDLPPNLEIGSLEMLAEVKLAHPAPWIESFRDIRDIKQSVRSRLLYDLLDALTQKEKLARTGVDLILDRLLRMDRPDLEIFSRFLDLLAKMPEEHRATLLAHFEGMDAPATLQTPATPKACTIPILSRIERDVLRALFESGGGYQSRQQIRRCLERIENPPTPGRLSQILSNLVAEGLLWQIHGRTQGRSHVSLFALSPQGLEVCRATSLEMAARPVLPDQTGLQPEPSAIERLLNVALDEHRDPRERGIALGALASGASDDTVRRLQGVVLHEREESRRALAGSALARLLRAREIEWPAAPPRVLLVEDDLADLAYLVDFLRSRGYEVIVASTERAARHHLEAVKQGTESYALALVDVMLPVSDLFDLAVLDETFFNDSLDSGLRLCRYARRELGLSDAQLPIACLTGRDDKAVRQAMSELGIPLFNRAPGAQQELLKFLGDTLA